jgi:hypothetical protein
MQADFTTFLFSGLGAGGLVVLGGHLLSRSRDRQVVKERFLAFMHAWESEVRIGFHSRLGTYGRVAELFSIRLPSFAAERVPIRRRFWRNDNSERFSQLCERISLMTPGQIDSQEGNKKLLDAIRALISFVERN